MIRKTLVESIKKQQKVMDRTDPKQVHVLNFKFSIFTNKFLQKLPIDFSTLMNIFYLPKFEKHQ